MMPKTATTIPDRRLSVIESFLICAAMAPRDESRGAIRMVIFKWHKLRVPLPAAKLFKARQPRLQAHSPKFAAG